MSPLVSILIPAFNAERWIADTIRSALAQTWPAKEILLVDDGSSDGTVAIAQRFAPQGVRVVTQKNQGAAAARNKAFELSRGDYIQWLDADDLLGPDKISRQMKALEQCRSPRIVLSSGWGRFAFRSSKANFTASSLWQDLDPVEWVVRKFEENLYMQTATWLVSRELSEAAGPWDTRLLGDDDGEYFCRVVLRSEGTHFVPEARTFYRDAGADSLSYVGRSSRKLEAQFLACQLNISHLRALDDGQRVRAASLQYLQRYQIYFYPERLDLFRQSEQLALSLNGQLELPRLSWKYSWLQKLFGWTFAKRTQLHYNQLKSSLLRSYDRWMFKSENARSEIPKTGPPL